MILEPGLNACLVVSMSTRELYAVLSIFAWLKTDIAVTFLVSIFLGKGIDLFFGKTSGLWLLLSHWHVKEENITSHSHSSTIKHLLEELVRIAWLSILLLLWLLLCSHETLAEKVLKHAVNASALLHEKALHVWCLILLWHCAALSTHKLSLSLLLTHWHT